MSAYLVTGCAGFIGSHLAERLLEDGHDVVGVDSFTEYYERARKEENVAAAVAHSRFRLVEADLAEADLGPLLGEAAGVFHLAAQPGVRASWGESFELYARRNLVASQRLFEAAAQGAVRVVWASSSSVYGDAESYPTREDTPPAPISPYGITKLACEHMAGAYARSFGLDVVTLRYFTVYGPRQRPDMAFARLVAALVEEREFTVFGTGEQSRQFTYVDDVVDATVAAFERAHSGRVYNVGGGVEATLAEAIATLERLGGRALELRHAPPMAGDVRRTGADVGRLRADTGWEPRTSLEDGLAAHLAWARTVAGTVGPR